ncbi:hypothetical protein SUNI508_10157 [Seiridium unicorne]|uniref:Uncharacterized protein n=1 Tax=Seiridium unicorne TaxID=138068 RepID=A0ABR2UMV6_9PEZI
MESPDANPKPTAADGIFAEQVGLDATSLWAAATSGGAAIAIHRLSCLLARVWLSSEATAIWVELVEGRRQELTQADETRPLRQGNLHLSRVAITRDQLSIWDIPRFNNQNDPLVSLGGILTIGLQLERETVPGGVFWSLPLGHLRYYGGPVRSEKKPRHGEKSCHSYGPHPRCDIMVRIRDYVSTETEYILDGNAGWLGLLAQALEPLLGGGNLTIQQGEQLLRFGKKRATNFICPDFQLVPMFGLCDVETLLLMIDDV